MDGRLARTCTVVGGKTTGATGTLRRKFAAGASAMLALIMLLPSASAGAASSDHLLYADALATNWGNWSWWSTVDFAARNAYAGSRSISWRIDGPWGGLYLHSDELVATTDSTSLTFALRTTASDQRVTVSLYGERNQQLAKPRPLSQLGGDPPAGSWKLYEIPWPSSLERGQQLAASSSKMARGQRSRSFSWTKSG